MLGNRSRWLLLFVGWSLFGAVQALMNTVPLGKSGEALFNLVAFYLPLAWMWAALTPIVGFWSQAIRRRFPSLVLRVAAHLPFLLAAALLHTWLRRALIVAMGNALNIPFEVTLLYFADMTIASYLAAVWAARVLEANATLTAKERHALDLKRQLVSAQMEYLELQLRPHFLFNALSTIAELAHEAPRNAARMLQNVVALLESAVARAGSGLVPLSEELDALRPYLDIQRLRFTDWLVIEEDAADDAKRALVPRFILQPLVENAVHHGLIKRTARGQIAIRARVEGERLLIAVADNGVGLAAAASYRESRGLGLANLRARLDAVYDGKASIELHDEAGEARGTVARIDLPLRTALDVQAVIPSDQPVIPSEAKDDWGFARDDTVRNWVMAHPVLAATIGWAAIALLRIQHSYAYMMLRDRFTPAALGSAIRFDLTVAGLWLLMTPLVIGLARRVPLRRDRIALRVLAHVVCAVALAYWHAGLTRFISGGFQSPLWSGVSSEIYAWNIAVYAIMLAIAHARDLDAWIRDRELVAEHLRKELKEAHFRRVMLELRPRVLLDTLRHLVGLVTESAKRSERILADVGDFLRATLNAIHEPTVTLREESETVRAYARVLGVASVPGLTMQLAVPLALMDEPVPNGVLRVALDSVLDNRSNDNTQVRLDVSRGVRDRGIAIRASAQRAGGQPSSWSATVSDSGSEFAAEVLAV